MRRTVFDGSNKMARRATKRERNDIADQGVISILKSLSWMCSGEGEGNPYKYNSWVQIIIV